MAAVFCPYDWGFLVCSLSVSGVFDVSAPSDLVLHKYREFLSGAYSYCCTVAWMGERSSFAFGRFKIGARDGGFARILLTRRSCCNMLILFLDHVFFLAPHPYMR